MAEKLTYQQQQAVDTRGGKLLVSAAAGSGKTKVLVDRLLKYINDPVSPANVDDFLVITYTKAAAAELRGKIAAKLSEHIAADPGNRHLQRQMQRLYLTKISTVHAFCADILREFAYRLNISPDFRVGDENECTQLRFKAMDAVLDQAYHQLHQQPEIQAFVDTQGLGRSDTLVPEIVERVYDSAMCHLDPQKWRDSCIENVQTDDVLDPLQTVWGRYLAEELFACLDQQIAAMERCAAAVENMEGMAKPAALLRGTVSQLQNLRQSTTWDEIVARKKIDYGRLVFPKKTDDPAVTEPVKAVRKACKDLLDKKLKNFSDSAQQVMEDLNQSTAAAKGLMSLVSQFADAYGELKKNRRILDFSDLEHRTLDLLWGKRRSGITAMAREIGLRFREIMVDEYQDSNQVQDAIFGALTDDRQNLFMVGDVKQSIYQFRLADPSIFLEKYATYAEVEEAQPQQGRKVLLSHNFRSCGSVIDAVNDVFSDCMSETVGGLEYGEAEALREGIPHCKLQEPEVELHGIAVREETYAEEAAYVAEQISNLLSGQHFVRQGDDLRPIRPEDIVILLRSPGSVGMEFQKALEQRGIPCAGSGGADLLQTEEIGTLRSLLQIISNPRQDIPLVAALASPVFAFTADELAAIRSRYKRGSIYDALKRADDKKTAAFLNTLDELRACAAMNTLPELLEVIFRLTQLDTIFSAMDGGEIRKANLQSFYQLAVDYSAMGSGSLDRFLEYLEAMETRGLPGAAEQPTGGCVTIMSIHKSKGLEFPVVFLCGLSRRFNQEDLRQQVLCHKELGLGLSCVDRANRVRYPTLSRHAISAKLAAESISEEMRVLYVAMTRARDRLIMTYASQNIESEIRDIAMRMDLSGKGIMTGNVHCPGQWILYSALQRTEAGAFFALGERPSRTYSHPNPWKITLQVAPNPVSEVLKKEEKTFEEMDAERLDCLRQRLAFSYGHSAATKAPSKQTATQKKGRIKDQEALEYASEPKPIHRRWRKPAFLSKQLGGTDYGNAIHAVLQYIRFDQCTDIEHVQQEVARLVEERFITPEQGAMADCRGIADFFATPMGEKIRTHSDVLREFKFSILDDAEAYGENLSGEQVLLQGVVDCALIEPDGITVIDFKTDSVTDETVPSAVLRYEVQVQTYADALSRIYALPVKAKALYFFRLNQFVWL